MTPNSLELAVIGNCGFSALINQRARVVWCCLPRFDSDPTFCSLLTADDDPDAHGFYDVEIEDFDHAEQHYVTNTAILTTTLFDTHGSAVQVTDFAPRFRQLGRYYRPIMIVRQIKPVMGDPRIRVRLRPAGDYGATRPERTQGSNHIRYVLPNVTLRLTTDVPVSYVQKEVPFVLEREHTMILGPDETLSRPIGETGHDFHDKTMEYWYDFTRQLSIPFEWQDVVIRSAITLKMCSFEETGAIIAAMTTSIPEAANSGRNWDYRFCWPRDAYFVVQALNRLGATVTMEGFLNYITNIAAAAKDGLLQPVYGITHETQLTERIIGSLPGYRGMAPVRVGNQAHEHIQNDVYGAVIMAATQAFFDQRLAHRGNRRLFERLEALGDQAARLYDQPDAGLWELRTQSRVHTFSSVMCWVACDRLAKIAAHLGVADRATHWRQTADDIHRVICERAWNAELGGFADSFGGSDVDASLLLLHDLGFLAASDPRFAGTVAAIEQRLRRKNHMMRYVRQDDFGSPENAFTICTFWYIDALEALGRRDEARALYQNLLACRNHVGLLSEDLNPASHELWGNFPQTYSLVGLILSAMRLSKPWEEAF